MELLSYSLRESTADLHNVAINIAAAITLPSSLQFHKKYFDVLQKSETESWNERVTFA